MDEITVLIKQRVSFKQYIPKKYKKFTTFDTLLAIHVTRTYIWGGPQAWLGKRLTTLHCKT
jgi:hypothetical protein